MSQPDAASDSPARLAPSGAAGSPFTVGVEPRCYALVPCAGTGSRSGSITPKQYSALAGQPLVAHTLQALLRVRRLDGILVVLAPDDEQFEEELPAFAGEGRWVARCGGASRAESVAQGLAELRARGVQPHDWVLVHDAARCLLRPEWVETLIETCRDDEVGGLLALPVSDTLKAEASGRVDATVDRSAKWSAQTPQMFRLGLLEPALRAAASAGRAVTDEASAVEALGHRPRLVTGSYENFKVTWPADFALAERLLMTAQRGAEIRPTVPAVDFELAQSFYRDMGFTREFSRGRMAGFRLGLTAFLLQGVDALPADEPMQLHLTLADLGAFWARIRREGLAERYQVRLEPPVERAWGRKDMALWDPHGVCWRIAERMEVVE